MAPYRKLSTARFKLSYSKEQCLTLVVLSSVSFASGICRSLQGPLYPREAEKKGASAAEYGLVFGIYELVAFIVTPIYGKHMHKFGPKVFVNCGMVLAGLFTALFGVLEVINSHFFFLSFSLIFGIIASLGTSATFFSSFSITRMVFPNNIGTTYSVLECSYGLGFVLGPTIGGYLLQVGGFFLPFIVVGTFSILVAVLIFFTLPSVYEDSQQAHSTAQLWSVLKMKPVLLNYFVLLSANLTIGFNVATLEPHLRQFGLSHVRIGATFAITASAYLLSTPLLGRVCDTSINPMKLVIVGALLMITSYSLMGPLPFLPIQTSMWMINVGLILHGLAMSFLIVPGFIDAIRSAIRCGMPDDLNTTSIVTGMSTSSLFLGAFLGPSLGGVLIDAAGYRHATLFLIAVHACLLFATSSHLCMGQYNKPSDDENAEKTCPLTSQTSLTTQTKDYGSNAVQDN